MCVSYLFGVGTLWSLFSVFLLVVVFCNDLLFVAGRCIFDEGRDLFLAVGTNIYNVARIIQV